MMNRLRPATRRSPLGLGAALLVSSIAVLTTSCECGTPEAALSITSPSSGSTFTLSSDVNPDETGVQIDVTVLTEGLAGELLTLQRAGAPLGRVIAEDGEVSFEVTIDVGSQVLFVSARDGELRSDDLTVTLTEDPNCGGVSFTTPVAPADGPLTLGAADNTNGGTCATGFETTVVAATDADDGTEGRVFVNGMPSRTAFVEGGMIRFEGVGLGVSDNQLSVRVGASTCAAEPFPAVVRVACEGVDCAIVSPQSDTGFLNRDDDVSEEDGFQGDFTVATVDGAGRPVRLIVDGDTGGALERTASATSVTFGNLSLTEGVHRLVAECQGAEGTVSRSAPVEYTVDVTPCVLEMDLSSGERVYSELSDRNESTPEIDISLNGFMGEACRGLRVAVCSGIEHMPLTPLEAGFDDFWVRQIPLAWNTPQEVCAQAVDVAGNLSEERQTVHLSTTAPLLEIAQPIDGTRFNLSGDALHTADLALGNETCEAAFEVYCTEIGQSVVLETDTRLPLSVADCVVDGSVPTPFAGRAAFPGVSLPAVDSGATFLVYARQTVDDIERRSAPIALAADCVAPAPSLRRPSCGATLSPETQDESPGVEGLQFRTEVENLGGGALTLEVRSADAVVYSATDTSGDAVLTFDEATYDAGGALAVVAIGVDSEGNTGVSEACTVTVTDLPTLTVSSPAFGSVVSDPGSCASGEVLVTGTSDAADGSAVRVSVRGIETVGAVTGGVFSVCAEVADGRDVELAVAVTDARGTARAGVTVSIDRAAPTQAIDDLSVEVTDRRGGIVRFGWTGVEDADGLPLASYALRCADAAIVDDAGWDAAVPTALATQPSLGTPTLSEDVGGFRITTTVHCALRGVDPAGELTPRGPSVEVALAFRTQAVFGAALPILGSGSSIAAVGDVSGDGIADVAVGGAGGVALHFGDDGPREPTLVSDEYVRIQAPEGSTATEWRPVGLGDFNGDGLSDFAVVGVAPDTGVLANETRSVYVFFGRMRLESWPQVCQIDGASCRQDLTIVGTGPQAFGTVDAFAASIAPVGDFDGDGRMDFAVGDIAGAGTVTVILGRSLGRGAVREVPGDTETEADGFVFDNPGEIAAFGQVVGTPGGTILGDARPDVLVLADQGTDAAIYALVGQPYIGTGLVAPAAGTTQELFARRDPTPVNGLGAVLTSGGDLDGDGDLDFLSADDGDGSGAGLVFVQEASLFGPPSDVTGATGLAGLGRSVAMARHPAHRIGLIGDIDADGVADLFLGSDDNADGGDGVAALFFGAALAGPRDLSAADFILTEDTDTGARVAAFVGDLTGDGYPDLVVGEPGNSTAGRFTLVY
ncbi:MAG: integrin alpha [Sandaracinaceae bacterium]